MAINIISEKYNGVNGLKANIGDIVNGELLFAHTVEHAFNSSNGMLYKDSTGNNGGVYELSWASGNWSAEGFSSGDDIEIEFLAALTCGTTSAGTAIIKYLGTVSYVDTDTKKIILTGALVGAASNNANYPAPPFANFAEVHGFPGSGFTSPNNCADGSTLTYVYGDGYVRKVTRPAELEFFFNLTPNGSISQSSVINGQVNRFVHQLPATTSLVSVAMAQMNSASGGYFKSVNIQQTQDLGATTEWKISYKFVMWGFVEDGFLEPEFNDAADCLAPSGLLNAYANAGNPNGVLSVNTSNNIGNTGGFGESYNGGVSPFSFVSIDWTNISGSTISALDYSAPSNFKAVVETGGSQTAAHGYKLGIAFRPEDATVYNDTTQGLGNNLLINAVENLLPPNGTLNPAIFSGEQNSLNAGFDFSNLKFTIVGTTLEIEGLVTPKSGSNSYFSNIADGGRRTTMWVSLSTGVALGVEVGIANRVSFKLFDADNIDAPIIGVQIPNVVSSEMYDHNLNSLTQGSLGSTTTEDDVLYVSEFKLPTNIAYEGLRTRISAFNSVTNESFVLENNFVSFLNSVTQNGVIQVNETITRNFNLPPTTDRNEISIKRKPSLDSTGLAGYQLDYGFLNDWRYWLAQNNANADFYDIAQPNSGLSKNWQRYYSGNWLLRVSYYTDLAGIEDFNNYNFNIRPYGDEVDVNYTSTLTLLSDGSNPTALIANELMEIQVVFTWTSVFADEWVEFTIENKEGSNRWVMSSVKDQGNISANPLKPISGETKIQALGTGTTTLTCKALIDTSLISVDTACLSYRVFSSGGVIVGGKMKTDGTYKMKTDGTVKLIS